MASDNEQRSINVPLHKRLAQGAPINGQSMKDTGQKKQGGLAHVPKKHK